MSGLFDADEYLKPGARPRPARRTKPGPTTTRTVDDGWVLVAQLSGVDARAHRVYQRIQGVAGVITRCELLGRPIPVERGREIVPCPTCGMYAP